MVTAYGIAGRIVKQVAEELREEGVKIGVIRPITLFPFPKESFKKLDYSKVKGIIDIEMTIPAQMGEDVEAAVQGKAPVFEYGHSGGVLLDDYDVKQAIKGFIAGGKEEE